MPVKSLFLLLGYLIFLSSCGSSGSTGSGSGGGGVTGPPPIGPIDGTWKETGTLCNGIAATGTATQTYTFPNSLTYVVTNTTGTATFNTGGCSISSAMTISYAPNSLATVTATGTWACSPTGCAGATCGAAVSTVSTSYQYSLNLPAVSLLVAAGTDQTCTGANPVQANPVTHTFTKQ